MVTVNHKVEENLLALSRTRRELESVDLCEIRAQKKLLFRSIFFGDITMRFFVCRGRRRRFAPAASIYLRFDSTGCVLRTYFSLIHVYGWTN